MGKNENPDEKSAPSNELHLKVEVRRGLLETLNGKRSPLSHTMH